ncbi:MAG: PQQ-binding-like beta-propeller repeat protein [candidate division WOR-3 bacterium]|nr:MAG: PQQ-binding-like beta-propeller repeat protein [candidate division WOR-3 bacterium]
MKKLSIVRVISLIIILSSVVLADHWRVGTGGNPARNGLSGETGPVYVDTLWSGGLSAVIAQQVVIEDSFAVMARIFNLNDVLHGTYIVCHNLYSGDTLWTADLPVDFPSTDWRNRVSAIRDGKVYVTRSGNTNASYLYALDVLDGSIIWQSDSLIDEGSTEGVSFAANGDLIVGNFSNVMRINASDGSTMWKTTRYSPTSNGSEIAVSGNMGYGWKAGGPVIAAFDLDTGAELYTSPPIGGGIVQQVAPFVGPDGTVYATRTQNNPITDSLVALMDIDTALVWKWSVPLGYVPFASFGVGPDSSVYSYTTTNRIIRIDHETGIIIDSSQVIPAGTLFKPRCAIDAQGIVYLTDGQTGGSGNAYSFDPDLTLRWTIPVPGNNVCGPALGQEGILVLCGTGTTVLALQSPTSTAENDATSPLATLHISAFPNPFRTSTTISLQFHNVALHNQILEMTIFDLAGRMVKTIDCPMPHALSPSLFTWHGDDETGSPLPGGVYILTCTIGQQTVTEKILLLK